MTHTLVEQYVQDPDNMRLYQQELAILKVTELIESVMDELGVSRAELARKLGQSKAWVTQLLDGDKNKTIRTVSDVLAVLGREFCVFQSPIRIGLPVTAQELMDVTCKLYNPDQIYLGESNPTTSVDTPRLKKWSTKAQLHA